MTTTATIYDAERFVAVFRAAAVARKSTGLGEHPIIEGVHLSYDAAADELAVKGTDSYVLFEGALEAGGDNNFAVTLSADVAKAIATDKTLAGASRVVIDLGPEADATPNVMISVDGAPRWVCVDAGEYPRTASLWPPATGEVAALRDGLEELWARRLRNGHSVLDELILDASEARLRHCPVRHLVEVGESDLAHRADDRVPSGQRHRIVLFEGTTGRRHGRVQIVVHPRATASGVDRRSGSRVGDERRGRVIRHRLPSSDRRPRPR